MDNIETIVEAAQHLTGTERDTYLAQACKGDAALKARLLRLVELRAETEGLDGGRVISHTGEETRLELPAAEGPGSLVGRYKLREKIGEGGCGVVYLAEQEIPVRRRVALKVIKLGMDTRGVVARFEAERQALAIMDHPHIAEVLDAGSTETGRPYFVMELVRGIKITEYCDQNKLATNDRLHLFIKVCQAVQHAHQKGIIHRDLKPSNILVALQDGVPHPKIIDFGIAKATEGRLSELTVYTQLHQFIGTPAYMSPEQAEMGALDIDTRSDIYSLGVVLYELLTGRTPFEINELARAGVDAIRQVIRDQEPPRPSTRLSTMDGSDLTTTAMRRATDPVRLIRLLRGDLDWIVMKALEKDRTRRYETANGLAADLSRHLNNEPVAARPPSALYRLQNSIRRNRLAYAAAGAVALALVLGAVVSSRQAVRARAAEKLANARLAQVAAERDAKEQARLESEQVSRFLEEVFQSPNPGRDGRTVTVAETLDRAAKRLDADLGNQPERRARLEKTLAFTYIALGLPGSAIPLLKRVRNLWAAKLGEQDPKTIEASIDVVEGFWKAGQIKEAVELGERTLALSQKINGPDHEATLCAMQQLAGAYYLADRNEESLRLQEDVLARRRKDPSANPERLQRVLNNLSSSYLEAGHYQEGLKLLQEARELARKIYPANAIQNFLADSNLAIALYYNGRKAEALTILEEFLPRAQKVLGKEHPSLVLPLLYLGWSRLSEGHKEEGLQAELQANTLVRKLYGTEHPESARVFDALSGTWVGLDRFDEFIKFWADLFESRQKAKGLADSSTIEALRRLAVGYGLQTNWTEARSQLLRLQDVRTLPDSAHQALMMLPCIDAYIGDRASYEAHRDWLLTRFGDTKSPEIAERIGKVLLLLPPNPDQLKKLETLSTVALMDTNYWAIKHSLFTGALASYRAGDWAAAAARVERSLELARTGPPSLQAMDYAVLSMARQRLAQPAEARYALEKGTQILDQRFPFKTGTGDMNWHDLLVASLLLREAQGVILSGAR